MEVAVLGGLVSVAYAASQFFERKKPNQPEPKKAFGAMSARGGASNRDLFKADVEKTKIVFPTLNIPSSTE